ncbi:hypothetical protein D3C71_1576770 [compost metagenome]
MKVAGSSATVAKLSPLFSWRIAVSSTSTVSEAFHSSERRPAFWYTSLVSRRCRTLLSIQPGLVCSA